MFLGFNLPEGKFWFEGRSLEKYTEMKTFSLLNKLIHFGNIRKVKTKIKSFDSAKDGSGNFMVMLVLTYVKYRKSNHNQFCDTTSK